MDAPSARETTQDLPELTDAELERVIGGNDTLNDAVVTVFRRIGTCGCGVAH